MRKKIFSSVFALALLATAGWGVNKSMSNDAGLSDLALSNVEALAQNEDDYPEFWENCAGSWDPIKCVCGNRAFTYAEAVKSPCSTESM
jgi:hypothetical protein